ncbi:hypothetical protein RO21_00815 [[Actinobacillus] muris]|uniref:DUF721 domain-containing protein n=1 Tax=Muribacter muris TaxID=67855 RepID=A0A0J5P9M8_9PAST|nr:DciA family protein [Muribacter muris]KMK52425.1 hypothetical protein RO21_00815 [[Actinobacillus] muris] [Muribacter muris]
MKKNTTRNIGELLQNSSLAKIVQRANELNMLNHNIQQLLPSQYRGLYRIVNLYDNLLVFEVQNATVRQGLLLQQAHLLKCIQTDLPQVSELQFKVNPDFKPV